MQVCGRELTGQTISVGRVVFSSLWPIIPYFEKLITWIFLKKRLKDSLWVFKPYFSMMHEINSLACKRIGIILENKFFVWALTVPNLLAMCAQREEICGNEGGEECRALHRNSTGWNQVAEIGECLSWAQFYFVFPFWGIYICHVPNISRSSRICVGTKQCSGSDLKITSFSAGPQQWSKRSKQRESCSVIGWLQDFRSEWFPYPFVE